MCNNPWTLVTCDKPFQLILSGHIRKDKIRNEYIRESWGDTYIEKLVESRLSYVE